MTKTSVPKNLSPKGKNRTFLVSGKPHVSFLQYLLLFSPGRVVYSPHYTLASPEGLLNHTHAGAGYTLEWGIILI